MARYLKNHRDKSEKPIVAALRDVGAHVFILSGDGVPDLLVLYRGTWTPLEVKTPKKDRLRGNLDVFTPAQHKVRKFAACSVVETPEQALAAIGVKE